jgi:superfamily I DNA and RNA helicase
MSDSNGDSNEKLGSNLAQLIQQLEKIEFRTDRDLYQYARILRAIGLELNMRVAMDADMVSAILSQYKGKWWTFGAQSKVRAKLVGAHLRTGASAAKVLGLSGIKMYASFVKHFIQPEIEAERKAREGNGKKPGFSIGDKPNTGSAGRPGEAGGRVA